jgi:hypothetical protein
MILQQVDSALMELLKEVHQEDKVELLKPDTLKVTLRFEKEEPLDYHAIYELIQTDFDQTITMLLINPVVYDFMDEKALLNHLIKLPKKVYDIETYLISLIKRDSTLIPMLQKRFVKLLGYEMIETILAIAKSNMNLSITAKNHYMHRNTLHYRIDKIMDKTSINIKTFKGLSVFTLLFED